MSMTAYSFVLGMAVTLLCGAAHAETATATLRIGTGSVTGVYYPTGSHLSSFSIEVISSVTAVP